jgi:hypothetical protein
MFAKKTRNYDLALQRGSHAHCSCDRSMKGDVKRNISPSTGKPEIVCLVIQPCRRLVASSLTAPSILDGAVFLHGSEPRWKDLEFIVDW